MFFYFLLFFKKFFILLFHFFHERLPSSLTRKGHIGERVQTHKAILDFNRNDELSSQCHVTRHLNESSRNGQLQFDLFIDSCPLINARLR